MKNLWVDTDIALGSNSGDVDDGFALAAITQAALRWPQRYRLLGVSAVAGNTDAATAARCARALLGAMGCAKVPVIPAQQAAKALAALPVQTHIVALGPLSNVAAAIALKPGLPPQAGVHLVGSVLRPWRHPLYLAYDLNLKRNRSAARSCLAAAFMHRTICPLDVVQRLRFGPAELAAIAATGRTGAYLANHAQRWAAQSGWRYCAATFPVWDLVAALDALGLLPGAEYSAAGQLQGFDATAARQQFLQLWQG